MNVCLSFETLVREVKQPDETVFHITTDAKVVEAARCLAELRLGLVLVCYSENHFAGVLSERDTIRSLGALETTVERYITPDVFTCGSTDRVSDMADVISKRRFPHAPIDDGGVLKRRISASDIVTYFANVAS